VFPSPSASARVGDAGAGVGDAGTVAGEAVPAMTAVADGVGAVVGTAAPAAVEVDGSTVAAMGLGGAVGDTEAVFGADLPHPLSKRRMINNASRTRGCTLRPVCKPHYIREVTADRVDEPLQGINPAHGRLAAGKIVAVGL
jgi:hypothetical protein